jgi:hypothetical protein
MRLWSLHPKYLDQKGLVALWREGLLAQKVLLGKTKGYKHHPQLVRFQDCETPVEMIGAYLAGVADEADKRGYQFDRGKIPFDAGKKRNALVVTRGQVQHEFQHLLKKLRIRDREKYMTIVGVKRIRTHPLFQGVSGKIADWERV